MWIRTKAGKNMPVNPEMVSYRRPEAGEKATEKIVTQAGEVVSANRVDSNLAEGIGYISHFATCVLISSRFESSGGLVISCCHSDQGPGLV